jgi:hypothetical protein
MTLRTLRALLIVDVVLLVLVAAIHAGFLLGGSFQRAAMYEAAVAAVLVLGLGLTFGSPGVARVGAFATQLVALFGVGMGIYMALNGMAPNSVFDLGYLALAAVLLVVGLIGALRLDLSETTGDRRGMVRS